MEASSSITSALIETVVTNRRWNTLLNAIVAVVVLKKLNKWLFLFLALGPKSSTIQFYKFVKQVI